MRRKTYEINCGKCGKLLFRYIKYGDGNLVNCYKKRILEDHSVVEGEEVRCGCGNVVGIDRSQRIKMKQHAIDLE